MILVAMVCSLCVEDRCVEGSSAGGDGYGGCCEGRFYVNNVVNGGLVGTV